MNTKFYEFMQNSSGGHFDIDENVSHVVYIEATSEEEAHAKMDEFTKNGSGSCAYCGDRWNRCWEVEGDVVKVAQQYVNEYTWNYKTATIHYKNREKVYIKPESEEAIYKTRERRSIVIYLFIYLFFWM